MSAEHAYAYVQVWTLNSASFEAIYERVDVILPFPDTSAGLKVAAFAESDTYTLLAENDTQGEGVGEEEADKFRDQRTEFKETKGR